MSGDIGAEQQLQTGKDYLRDCDRTQLRERAENGDLDAEKLLIWKRERDSLYKRRKKARQAKENQLIMSIIMQSRPSEVGFPVANPRRYDFDNLTKRERHGLRQTLQKQVENGDKEAARKLHQLNFFEHFVDKTQKHQDHFAAPISPPEASTAQQTPFNSNNWNGSYHVNNEVHRTTTLPTTSVDHTNNDNVVAADAPIELGNRSSSRTSDSTSSQASNSASSRTSSSISAPILRGLRRLGHGRGGEYYLPPLIQQDHTASTSQGQRDASNMAMDVEPHHTPGYFEQQTAERSAWVAGSSGNMSLAEANVPPTNATFSSSQVQQSSTTMPLGNGGSAPQGMIPTTGPGGTSFDEGIHPDDMVLTPNSDPLSTASHPTSSGSTQASSVSSQSHEAVSDHSDVQEDSTSSSPILAQTSVTNGSKSKKKKPLSDAIKIEKAAEYEAMMAIRKEEWLCQGPGCDTNLRSSGLYGGPGSEGEDLCTICHMAARHDAIAHRVHRGLSPRKFQPCESPWNCERFICSVLHRLGPNNERICWCCYTYNNAWWQKFATEAATTEKMPAEQAVNEVTMEEAPPAESATRKACLDGEDLAAKHVIDAPPLNLIERPDCGAGGAVAPAGMQSFKVTPAFNNELQNHSTDTGAMQTTCESFRSQEYSPPQHNDMYATQPGTAGFDHAEWFRSHDAYADPPVNAVPQIPAYSRFHASSPHYQYGIDPPPTVHESPSFYGQSSIYDNGPHAPQLALRASQFHVGPSNDNADFLPTRAMSQPFRTNEQLPSMWPDVSSLGVPAAGWSLDEIVDRNRAMYFHPMQPTPYPYQFQQQLDSQNMPSPAMPLNNSHDTTSNTQLDPEIARLNGWLPIEESTAAAMPASSRADQASQTADHGDESGCMVPNKASGVTEQGRPSLLPAWPGGVLFS